MAQAKGRLKRIKQRITEAWAKVLGRFQRRVEAHNSIRCRIPARFITRGTVLIAAFAALSACGENADARYDAGYGDGYAVGYNTTCQIRSTLIEGDWDDKNYSRGYADGEIDGAAACNADRQKEK